MEDHHKVIERVLQFLALMAGALLLTLYLSTPTRAQQAHGVDVPPGLTHVEGTRSGGGMQWGYNMAERHVARGEPLYVTGHFFSAGNFILYSVQELPGSLIAPTTVLHFHEPGTMAGLFIGCARFDVGNPQRYLSLRDALHPMNQPVRDWYLQNVLGQPCMRDDHTVQLDGPELATMGYPVEGYPYRPVAWTPLPHPETDPQGYARWAQSIRALEVARGIAGS